MEFLAFIIAVVFTTIGFVFLAAQVALFVIETKAAENVALARLVRHPAKPDFSDSELAIQNLRASMARRRSEKRLRCVVTDPSFA